jgi:glycosyltransferase involved in cell wall biosynthesis
MEDLSLESPKAVFITRFSLSNKTAIGVQTNYLAESLENWVHFHWWQTDLKRINSKSHLLENQFIARFPRYKFAAWLQQLLSTFGLSWWEGDKLGKRAIDSIKEKAAGSTVAYVAPIDREDARRMRSILEVLKIPFILHIWDFLDGGLDTEEHTWLIKHADKVLCLSQPICEALQPLRPDVDILRFYRPPSLYKAKAPEPNILIITLIGDINAYSDGLDMLFAAIEIVEKKGVQVKVKYIGTQKALRRARADLMDRITVTGFLESAQDRDKALSESNIAFLPGPLKSPDTDYRSRYSIPSRVLDFMAVGLPIVGPVHPESATGKLLAEYGLQDIACCADANSMAQKLNLLADCSQWQHYSHLCQIIFKTITVERNPPQKLHSLFQEIILQALNAELAEARI